MYSICCNANTVYIDTAKYHHLPSHYCKKNDANCENIVLDEIYIIDSKYHLCN